MLHFAFAVSRHSDHFASVRDAAVGDGEVVQTVEIELEAMSLKNVIIVFGRRLLFLYDRNYSNAIRILTWRAWFPLMYHETFGRGFPVRAHSKRAGSFSVT